MALRSPSLVTLWLGESKSSTTRSIKALNTSGRNQVLFNTSGQFADATYSVFWGTSMSVWDLNYGCNADGTKV